MKISIVNKMPMDFELVLFGDDQEGNAAKATDKYLECIEYIRSDKRRYGIHMGDCMDAFWIDDFRYNEITVSGRPDEQLKRTIAQLTPLAKTGRLLSVLKGNHEKSLEDKLQRLGFLKESDINNRICEGLRLASKCEYPISGTYTNKIEFCDKKDKLMFKGYFTHGRKMVNSISPDPHRKRANMQYRLKLILEQLCGDAIIQAMGHIHVVLTTLPIKEVYLTNDKHKLKQHYTHAGTGKSGSYIPPEARFFGATGSFLRTFVEGMETYSELAQYPPTELGYLKATIQAGEVVDLQEVKI